MQIVRAAKAVRIRLQANGKTSMAFLTSPDTTPQNQSLQAEVLALLDQLPDLKYKKWIERSLASLVQIASGEMDRLDWKILSASLHDMQRAFEIFSAYRHVRKVTIFGSARMSQDTLECQMAREFARRVTELGFMVMTGAGPGIMEAGNDGAGADKSFGLNVDLPFEQEANPVMEGDPKLVGFKYFFTRKLFFLKESDSIALFPGGFGTQDEAFETLTLAQTGRYGPAPLVLIDAPGGSYWQDWEAYIKKHLVSRRLIAPEDTGIYTITDNVETACAAITSFYRVYHSSRYVDGKLVLRLKCPLTDDEVEQLNAQFHDILVSERIVKSAALPKEQGDETENLPRLLLHFNRRDVGRLYQMIGQINQMGCAAPPSWHHQMAHPETK